MRFLLFVEDRAERFAIANYLKRWLDPRLSKPVRIRPIWFNGKSDYLKDIAKKVELHLSGQSGADVIAAIGLVDLLTLDEDIAVMRGLSNVHDQCLAARQYMEQRVQHVKFRQHLAVYEIEAWLIASPQAFPSDAQAEVRIRSSNPEGIGPEESPAQLLHRIYRDRLGRRYKKSTDGSALLLSADPENAYRACARMLDDMLALARNQVKRTTTYNLAALEMRNDRAGDAADAGPGFGWAA